MPQLPYSYKVVSKINHKSIPSKLKDLFSKISTNELISTEMFFGRYRSEIGQLYNNEMSGKRAIIRVIKEAYNLGTIKRTDEVSVPKWFEELGTVSYWQSQLRGNRQKKSKRVSSTKSQYLYQLWIFNKWLSKNMFTINSLQINDDGSFRQKTEKKQFRNVEELLDILEKPFAEQKNITRIIKQYLLDKTHAEKKAVYIILIKSAIVSYFERNEQPLQLLFNPRITHSNTIDYEQSMSLSELMEFFTDGKPSITEKALFLCKFHRGLDASTLADRFNYEAWQQITKWFGSENHDSWDLEKCPVPISLIRVKTDFKHIGFLDRDAIYHLQKYLDYRKKKTGHDMLKDEPLFLNKFHRPISTGLISDSFSRIAERSGIQKFVKINGKKQFKMDSHELRDLLKSTLIDSGCRMYVADHVIGHKPKDSYEKQSKLYPETLRKEYAKASKRLNIFTKFTSVVNGTDDSDALIAELNEKKHEMNEMLEQQKRTTVEFYRNEFFAKKQQKDIGKSC